MTMANVVCQDSEANSVNTDTLQDESRLKESARKTGINKQIIEKLGSKLDVLEVTEGIKVANKINVKRSGKVCEYCHKKFRSQNNFENHKKQFTKEHKVLSCCFKIELVSELNNHSCKRGRHKQLKWENNRNKKKDSLKSASDNLGNIGLKQKNKEENMGKSVTKPPRGKENVENDQSAQEEVSDHELIDVVKVEVEDVDVNYFKEELHSDESEPDIFDEVFKKEKRSYKRRNVGKLNKTISNIKCVECSKVFSSESSLAFHMKVNHCKKGKLKCPTCDEIFDSQCDYEKHISLHGPEDKVLCKGCKRVFDSLKSYYLHAKQYPSKHCYLCKFCLRKFPSELLLEQHVCICINGKPFLCGCGKEFTKYIDVIKHSKGTKPFYCCSCSHSSTSLTAYLRHTRKHSKQKPFECKQCHLSFAVIDFLNIHTKKMHSGDGTTHSEVADNIYSCDICSSKFADEENHKKHMDSHNERVPCPDCGKSLKKNRLESHRSTHKASASLCPECGKLFDTRFKLTQHIITTHNSEPVKCETCDKVLKTKKIFNEHMKTHMKSEVGERIPQAICPMCGLGLAQKGSLARHILLMHEKHKIVQVDIPHECKECGEICPNKGKYYSHRRMHRAMVDRFPCELCGRVFNKKQNLRRHIYLLHDERRIIEDPIYSCQVCTRSFREKKNLRRHYKMVHKLDDLV